MTSDDPTLDPGRRSWLEVPPATGFPVQHLPWASFRRPDDPAPRLGVRVGEVVVDVRALADAGRLDGLGTQLVGTLRGPDLGGLLAAGPGAWRSARERLMDLLTDGVAALASDVALRSHALVPVRDVTVTRPFAVGDLVDFYSSLEHATNLGRLWRPDGEPLRPNWRHLPVGYHGRSRTVVVSGTPVVRPRGQQFIDGEVTVGPTRRLDYELEVGFVVGGAGNRPGEPIPVGRAADHVFGVVLVNDWSARDLQAWEYQPLGPFLGKSFATSMAGWVTPLAALWPFAATAPSQEPAVAAYLADDRTTFDLAVTAAVSTARMRAQGRGAVKLSEANLRDVYWTWSQQVAHLTVNGATVGAGDLFATGTMSGADRSVAGSLVEITEDGSQPVTLPGGEQRTFLEDGDEVVLEGQARPGPWSLSLGAVRGVIRSAVSA